MRGFSSPRYSAPVSWSIRKSRPKYAPVAFLPDLLADRHRGVLRLPADVWRKGRGCAGAKDLVAAPAARVGRQFGKPDQLGHQRPDQGAVASDTAFDRRLAAANPLHNLDGGLLGDLVGVGAKIRLGGNEKGGRAGVAVRQLDHQIRPQRVRDPAQGVIAVDRGQHIRHGWNTGAVGQVRGRQLVIKVLAQFGGGKATVSPRFRASASVCASNIRNSTPPPEPDLRT